MEVAPSLVHRSSYHSLFPYTWGYVLSYPWLSCIGLIMTLDYPNSQAMIAKRQQNINSEIGIKYKVNCVFIIPFTLLSAKQWFLLALKCILNRDKDANCKMWYSSVSALAPEDLNMLFRKIQNAVPMKLCFHTLVSMMTSFQGIHKSFEDWKVLCFNFQNDFKK